MPGRAWPSGPAAAARTGARRRASRQMKNEIPARTMSAPRTIAIALALLSELVPDPLVVTLVTVAVVELVVGTGASGVTPLDSGLDVDGSTTLAGVEAVATVAVGVEVVGVGVEVVAELVEAVAATALHGAASSSAVRVQAMKRRPVMLRPR
ncbi:MAG: hypothetical protein ACLPZR_11940 [Solirubrobacteraceae bacterium]